MDLSGKWTNNRLLGQMSSQSFAPESPANRTELENHINVRTGDDPGSTQIQEPGAFSGTNPR
jgi:hypothetical protein